MAECAARPALEVDVVEGQITFSSMAGGVKANRGSRVVGEIFDPIVGGAPDYLYRCLLSPMRGKAPTREAARALLLAEIERLSRPAEPIPAGAYRPSRRKSVAPAVELAGGGGGYGPGKRVSPAEAPMASKWRRHQGWVSCPDCQAPVKPANLEKHRRKVHGTGAASVPPRTVVKVTAMASPAAAKPVQSSSTSNPGLVPCPECRVSVSPLRLAAHRKRVHGAVPAARTATPTKTSSRATVAQEQARLCTDCGVWVFESLEEHRRQYHSSARRPSVKSAAPVPSTTSAPAAGSARSKKPSSVAVCPECAQKVMKHEMAAHREKHARQRANNERKTRAKARARSTRPAKQPAHDPAPYDVTAERRANRALDGSRDYGHTFREGGRFGSFPAYDDYGEESGG